MLAYFDRDPENLARTLAASPHRQFQIYAAFYPKAWFEGLNARLRGKPDEAQAAFITARADVTAFLDAHPTYSTLPRGLLGMIDAALGRRDDAVREAREACDKTSETRNATTFAYVHCQLAVVYAWTDQPDLALNELEAMARRPAGADLIYQVTYGDLKLNPMWDPLRSNPRFTALIAQLAPAK